MIGALSRRRLGEFALVLAVVAAAYWPVFHAGFIWDDDGHVTRADLRSWHGLGRIWFDLGATQQYYPVLHSAFWMEHRLWGDAALGYHVLNVGLHALAAMLFVAVLRRLWEGNGLAALLAGLIFALHPVGVESVAWISEQKNTLSTVFYLLAALTYLRWIEGRAGPLGPPGKPLMRTKGETNPAALPKSLPSGPALPYCVATTFFILALLSKSVTATLPAALLVVLWWKKGALSWRRDVAPLLPWFALSLAMAGLTAWVERTSIGARGAAFALSLGARGLLAGRIAWFYLGKLLWPTPLIFIYPRWTVDTSAAGQYLYPLGVLVGLAFLWRWSRSSDSTRRGPLAIGLLFLGTLFPALGFFDVYPFVFSYVADHFQYLASLSVIAGAAVLITALPRGKGLVAGIVLAALGSLTWCQCRIYRDAQTLFQATAERNPSSWLAQENLGVILANEGRTAEAFARYQEAVRLNPGYAETHGNYGNALTLAHRWADAAAEYREALRLRPDFAPATVNWSRAEYGWASELANGGHLAEAVAHYEQALHLQPEYPEARAELGLAEVYSGRLREAVADLRQAVRLKPGSAQAHAYLGLALAQMGQLPDAVAEYRESLRFDPRDTDVHYHLAMALRALGQIGEAAAEFEAAGRPRR